MRGVSPGRMGDRDDNTYHGGGRVLRVEVGGLGWKNMGKRARIR